MLLDPKRQKYFEQKTKSQAGSRLYPEHIVIMLILFGSIINGALRLFGLL